MATLAEPATDALFQALSSPEPDPQVVHAAIEEVRQIASQNVIAVLGAKIDAQGTRIDAQITEIRAVMKAWSTEVKAEIKAQNSRIDPSLSWDTCPMRIRTSRLPKSRGGSCRGSSCLPRDGGTCPP